MFLKNTPSSGVMILINHSSREGQSRTAARKGDQATSGRNTARAAVGGEFPRRTLSVVRRDPSSTIAHVSASPPSHPGQSDFPSPVGSSSFPQRTFPSTPKLKHSPAYAPGVHSYTSSSTSLEFNIALPGTESGRCFPSSARHLPRATLPATSVTRCGTGSTPPRQALPCPLRSYWLMRPTEILSPA